MRNHVSYGYVAHFSDEAWTHSFLHPSHRISLPRSLKRDPRDISPAVSVLTWLFAVTSPQSWRHTALVISIFISGGRRACFFLLFFRLCLSPLHLSPPLSLYLIHKMLFLSLTSALSNCYKQERIGLMKPEDKCCIGNVYQSGVCCRKAGAFVYQIKISVWKSEARAKFCPSVCYSVVLEAAV